MHEDIQKYFEPVPLDRHHKKTTRSIPREYVVQHKDVKVYGKGILQLLFENYGRR